MFRQETGQPGLSLNHLAGGEVADMVVSPFVTSQTVDKNVVFRKPFVESGVKDGYFSLLGSPSIY